MKYDGVACIQTTNNEINVGEVYDYYESFPTLTFQVQILEDLSDDRQVAFRIKILTGEWAGQEDVYSNMRDNTYYSGMWKFYDKGTYIQNTEKCY